MRASGKNTCNCFSDFGLSRGDYNVNTLRFGNVLRTNKELK